jgi:zinc transporter ZupT
MTETLGWIIIAGLGMSLLALSGSVTLVLSSAAFDRVVLPMVALAAGSVLGGALFHMLPRGVAEFGNELSVYVWLAAGLFSLFLLEQYLHWHHCHRSVSTHRPVGALILVHSGWDRRSALAYNMASGLTCLLGGAGPPARARNSRLTTDIRVGRPYPTTLCRA